MIERFNRSKGLYNTTEFKMPTKRITKTWRVVKMLYALPKNDYIILNDAWRRTNFKKSDVRNKLKWLKERRLVESIFEVGYENNHPYKKNKYRLSKGGRKYAKRRIEREKLEGVNDVA